jgi:hypothetical protein
MLQACETGGISMRSLVDTLRINAYTEKQGMYFLKLPRPSELTPCFPDIDTVRFTTAQEESPLAIAMKNSTHRFLTDSEDDVIKRASYAPDHLPFLPPSHSYKRTPVYPSIATPQQALAAGIPFVDSASADLSASTTGDSSTSADKRMSLLDERIRTTRLVEASLQNLIRATSKAGAPDPSGHAGEAQAGDAVNHDGTSVKKDEQIITLLKKYEKDAAICNFEVEWYGGARSGGAITVSEKEQGAGAGQQAAQRKRGRWKY